MKTFKPFQLVLIILLLVSSSIYSQKNDLKHFMKFTENNWHGHYVNSEDSSLNHFVKWTYNLDSNYVKQIKNVPEVNFKMETYYYYDYETASIEFISFLNKNMISKGSVKFNNDTLIKYENTFFENGKSESKSFFIMNGNTLHDYFYRKSKGKWAPGHYIIYRKE